MAMVTRGASWRKFRIYSMPFAEAAPVEYRLPVNNSALISPPPPLSLSHMARLCSPTTLLILTLLSAIPLSIIIALERTASPTHSYKFHSTGWFRECSKWDDHGRRFLVSLMEGGVAEVAVPENHHPGEVLEEKVLLRDPDLTGNSTVGILIDRPRNRLLVVYVDFLRNRYGALAAYDLSSWNRLFLAHLSGPGDGRTFADDVAIDGDGNAYVTDALDNKIWTVGINGDLLSTIKDPIFKQKKEWYSNIVGLNGIVYHPNGFLLTIHTSSGYLFKVDPATKTVSVVQILRGSLTMGDGLELLSPTRIVVAGTPSGRLVESLDGWDTASVVGRYLGPMHRMATAATVKDGKVYLNHMFGGGLPKRKHVLVEAVFRPLK